MIRKIYSVLKSMDSNFKFRGFIKKKIEEMKKNYYDKPNVAALCSNDEIENYKLMLKEGTLDTECSEEITIFAFLNEIVRSVEIITSNGENELAFYPKLPKVFFLTQNSLNDFRAECRIDQATTKVMDLMAYTLQFEIEMDVNYELSLKYAWLAKILSDDAFAMFKIVLWTLGVFINIGVIKVYEIIDGKLVAAPGYEGYEFLIFAMSFMQLFWSFVIICLWFSFRYKSIREIEREKFMIMDPGVNPDTPINATIIAINNSI